MIARRRLVPFPRGAHGRRVAVAGEPRARRWRSSRGASPPGRCSASRRRPSWRAKTAVLQHASNVPQCALALEEVLREAGFPPRRLPHPPDPQDAVAAVIEDARVHAVTLTGSDIAGSKVAEASGRAVTKTVLELGGSDPFIVLEDADVDAAARVGAAARNQNTGQSCIAAKHQPERRGYFSAPTVLSDVTQRCSPSRRRPSAPWRPSSVSGTPRKRSGWRTGRSTRWVRRSWTRDPDRARRLAGETEASSVFINGMVASEPRLPFGGMKRSGLGRELGEFGIREFVNSKTVWVGPMQAAAASAATA